MHLLEQLAELLQDVVHLAGGQEHVAQQPRHAHCSESNEEMLFTWLDDAESTQERNTETP